MQCCLQLERNRKCFCDAVPKFYKDTCRGAQWSAFHNEQYLATSRAFAGLADRNRNAERIVAVVARTIILVIFSIVPIKITTINDNSTAPYFVIV